MLPTRIVLTIQVNYYCRNKIFTQKLVTQYDIIIINISLCGFAWISSDLFIYL